MAKALVFGILMMAASALAVEQSVRAGQVVGTDYAILCLDLGAAKTLSDLTEPNEFQVIGKELLNLGACIVAGGSMTIDGLAYQGKKYNVFKAHDSRKAFYWVTIVKPTFD